MIPLGKTLMGATAATALAVAAPAQARDNDGIDGGDVLAGVLILGAAAAVIAAVTDDDDHDRYERNVRYDPRHDGRYDGRHGDRYGDRYGRNNRGYYRQNIGPRAAANRCAAAAERRASQYGRARVTEITDIDRERNGFDVEGRLVVNEGRWNNGWNNGWNRGRRWNAGYNDVDRGRFSCRIRYGQVERVRIRGID